MLTPFRGESMAPDVLLSLPRATIPARDRRQSIPGNLVRPAADARTGRNLTPFARRSISAEGRPTALFFLTLTEHRCKPFRCRENIRHLRTPPGILPRKATAPAESLCLCARCDLVIGQPSRVPCQHRAAGSACGRCRRRQTWSNNQNRPAAIELFSRMRHLHGDPAARYHHGTRRGEHNQLRAC